VSHNDSEVWLTSAIMRDQEVIDSELRLVAALRRAASCKKTLGN